MSLTLAHEIARGGLLANATQSSLVSRNIALLNRPGDIVWDGTGTGNRFQFNLCGVCVR